jgi:hypothetical protein
MNELLIVVAVLFSIVIAVVIYGKIHGGVEAMLDQERTHNTIDADDSLEVTVFIDFFNQIKRIDSLYFNAQTQTLQLKKNRQLSDSFRFFDIEEVRFQINDDVIFKAPVLDAFEELVEALESAELDDRELILTLTLKTTVHTIAFESPERCLSVVNKLKDWANV